MEFPKLDFDKPESFIAVYIPLIIAITVYPRDAYTPEYLYFYLCNIRFLFVILSIILITSVIFRVYTNPIHIYILKVIFVYTVLIGVYWYMGFSLSFENAIPFFLSFLLFITLAVIELVILIDLGIFLSKYDGNSRLILPIKKIYDFLPDNGSPERYRSLIHWNLNDEEKYSLKFIVGFFFLIVLSFSVLYLPSVLSSASPRLYDIYAIPGNIKADMDDEYTMDKIIYVPVEVGGLDTGLSMTLSKYNSGKFEEISALTLYPSESNTLKNNCLYGESNFPGSYKIYLDPTSMSTGDYELKFENAQNKNVSMNHVFALKPK